MPVEIQLKQRLAERGMSIADLAGITKIPVNALYDLANKDRQRIDLGHLERICVALGIGPEELLSIYQPNVFFGARRSGSLTIHVSHRWFQPDGWGSTSGLQLLAANQWDFEAFQIVHDHATAQGIQVKIQTHTPSEFAAYPQQAKALLDAGNHVVIASQLTSDLTEHVVSKMVGVPPADPTSHARFEMLFGWDRRLQPSSFGFQVAAGQSPGIYRPNTTQPIAVRDYVESGFGMDCGLIVVWRNDRSATRKGNRGDHYVVVAAGHGGPGTVACARILADPNLAKRLYPSRPRDPLMLAIQASYARPVGGPITQDNRLLNNDYHLVD